MRIFLTGGTGFLGKYFIKEAIKEGHELVCLCRRKYSNLKNSNKNINWIQKNITDLAKEDFLNIDGIVHLASAGVSPKLVSIQELIETNIKGSMHLVRLGYLANIKRFVFAGTCHEYGESANQYKYIPTTAPLKPLNYYASSKVGCFFLLKQFCLENDIELVYARIFSAYGIGQDKRNFWQGLYNSAIRGDDFEMTSGIQIRDFIKAEMVAVHLLQSLFRTDVKKGIPFVINIGSGKEISLAEFAKSEWNRLNAKGDLHIGNIKDRGNEPLRYVPDISNLFI